MRATGAELIKSNQAGKMAGHGGKRAGAGAPTGGVSETRRILEQGIKAGQVIAGRAYGLTGTDQEVAVKTVAHIVADMIKAGNGADVLKLQAVVESKAGDDGGQGEKSSLLGALGRMPSPAAVPAQSEVQEQAQEQSIDSNSYNDGTTDQQSVVPSKQTFFAPQKVLLFDGREQSDTANQAPREGGYPPHTPPPYPYMVEQKNFENSENFSEGEFSEVNEWA